MYLLIKQLVEITLSTQAIHLHAAIVRGVSFGCDCNCNCNSDCDSTNPLAIDDAPLAFAPLALPFRWLRPRVNIRNIHTAWSGEIAIQDSHGSLDSICGMAHGMAMAIPMSIWLYGYMAMCYLCLAHSTNTRLTD